MSPLVVAIPSSQPYRDCQALRDYSDGDPASKIVAILSQKTAPERKEIREAFAAMYKQDLCAFLDSVLQGNLQIAVSLWVRDPAERDAIIARKALERSDPDFFALVEILCARRPAEIAAVREAYFRLFKVTLENDIATETVGPQQKLLFALAKARRCPFTDVDESLAKADAKKLFAAREGRIGIDEAAIVKLLCERNLNHVRASLVRYNNAYGHHISEVLRSDNIDHFEGALKVIFRCISCPETYFCDLIHCALSGEFVDEISVIRVMVTRAEHDMEKLKESYLDKFGCLLEKAISARVSGPMRDFFLSLAYMRSSGDPQQT